MPKSKETISNPTAAHLPLPPNQVVTDPGGANLPGLAKLAAQAIQDKWQSTGGAPGAPKGDVTKSGTGFFRDYAGMTDEEKDRYRQLLQIAFPEKGKSGD